MPVLSTDPSVCLDMDTLKKRRKKEEGTKDPVTYTQFNMELLSDYLAFQKCVVVVLQTVQNELVFV